MAAVRPFLRRPRADGGGGDSAPEPTPGAQILNWWRRNGPPAPEDVADTAWQSLPPNVRQTYAGIPQTIAEFSPGAGVRDLVNESGNLSRATMNLDPMGMATAASGMGLAALGVVPGGRLGKVVKAGDEGVSGIRAYHGSPHDFDRFDMSRIGTGEGAQAYGHGLYFAESEPVAKQYRDALTKGRFIPQQTGLTDPFTEATHAALKVPGAYEPRAWEIGHQVETALRNGDDFAHMRQFVAKSDWSPVEKQMWKAALDTAEKFRWEGGKGHVYEVRLQADRDKFLDWDRPLASDSPLRKILGQSAGALMDSWRPIERSVAKHAALTAEREGITGRDLYQRLATTTRKPGAFPEITVSNPVAASEALRDSGIPGIKYLDAGSRGGGTGTQNFVVFDDRIIQIMRKYGWVPAGMVAGGMMMTPPEASAADNVAATARRYGGRLRRATGGPVSDGMPFNAGPLRAARPAGGRTDTLPIDVPQGAYIIPADIVSALGEGDTEAGYTALNRMFPESERQHRAAGGSTGPRAPIIAAGGEYVVHPESVQRLGGGDMKRGHDALDIFVKNQRRKTIKTLSKLPGPQR